MSNSASTPRSASPAAPFIHYIKAVGRGEKLKRDLTYAESVDALRQILSRRATEAQIGGFLLAQRVKGESVDEINGFVDVVRREFMRPAPVHLVDVLDLAAPYDGKSKTAQLAPAVAFVLAAAGVPVLLHGDEDVPTKSGVGPAAVLQMLGVPVDDAPETAARRLESCGLAYLAARHYAPAWHALLPIRRQFGLRTVLNTVEKLFNPADAAWQISGFYHANYIKRIRSCGTGTRASWMVQGEEGSIEMAEGRSTHIFAADPDDDLILAPQELGYETRVRIDLPPIPARHSVLNRRVLQGAPGPAREQVLLTAGSILGLVGQAADLADGVARAARHIDGGAALARLEQAASPQRVAQPVAF